ncbi:MAG: preprotein translocase subunit SecA, partial [Gammaproteobacteria bacterium]|nr:preprotein translocase subunit SecA [Gammaproteobacteria bacterium]
MFGASILNKIFGSRNQRLIKKILKTVNKINLLEQDFTQLSDSALLCKTNEFKSRIKKGESLDNILPEAFAAVRESARRCLNMRHFDVQLIGGIVMHSGKIAEMHTGEGKTLVATLPAYLNALTDKSVHIVTVNDYLVQRDANWMRPVYETLGMTVGIIIPNMSSEDKKQNYQADIVYATNNELGFDYLRDNMAYSLEDRVQKDRSYAIIDEVDSILIDEARTPLIISGPAENSSDLYKKLNILVPSLKKQVNPEGPGHFSVDEKHKQVQLTEEGHEAVEELLVQYRIIDSKDSLYSPQNISVMHHLNSALRAHYLFHKDVDYIISQNEIVIVDEHTGRTMPGRRWSDGLHQAVEAKEGVPIKQENQTLASITFQNYFRLYNKLAGMTGTADTEAFEFQQIYDLEVVVIPTNRAVVRLDRPDQIYLTAEEKFNAIVADIKQRREKQQPVLLGTASIETSEYLSKLLKKHNIPHQVLNAKFHKKEAEIIVDAGRPGVVTIATNMAGRGTDIVLGGNFDAELAKLEAPSPELVNKLRADWQARHDLVLKSGGLYVLGSERHESRRIDNQLRGRSGRQGDAGETRFYLSMDDNLMRIFASDRMKNMMASLGMAGNAIESKMITRSIKGAQHRVEGLHFEIRKQLLEYDDIANEQRKIIYDQRDYLTASENVHYTVIAIIESILKNLIYKHMPPDALEEQWDLP